MKTLRALFWGCVTGAALAYVFAPRRIDLLRSAYGRVSGRSGATTTNTTNARSEATNTATAGVRQSQSNVSGGAAATQAPHTSTLAAVNGQTATAENAAYIGNTHTQVYHNVTDSNLPNEENRAYFATAEDAEAAGYRAAGQTSQV